MAHDWIEQDWMELAAARAETRLQQAGIELTLGGEPTYVPIEPEGAEWSVAADGPTKLPVARAMARAIRGRTWPGSTLIYCSGKRYEGEVNPRWALRLVTGLDGHPIAPWPVPDGQGQPLAAAHAKAWLKQLGQALGVPLQRRRLQDPLDPQRQVWAVPLTWDQDQWHSSAWPLPRQQRQLTLAPGPAGLRLPLEYLPDGTLRTELFARRAMVQPDMSISASGIVFRVFATNGTVETTITAEEAEFNRERLTGRSDKAVSMQQGDLLVTGEGFRWNGASGTLLIRRRARIAFPSEMIRKERISSDDKQNK